MYQDWAPGREEGILDIAAPMDYKAEHVAAQRPQWDQWSEWTKNHAYNRRRSSGQGAFVNAMEGTLRQVRRAFTRRRRATSPAGHLLLHGQPERRRGPRNPFASLPPATSRPGRLRWFAEFAAGLTTGRSVDGTLLYEDRRPPGARVRRGRRRARHAVEVHPEAGHLMGRARRGRRAPWTRARSRSRATRRRAPRDADDDRRRHRRRRLLWRRGSRPGHLRGHGDAGGTARLHTACTTQVTAGRVARFDVAIDREAPTVVLSATPRRALAAQPPGWST